MRSPGWLPSLLIAAALTACAGARVIPDRPVRPDAARREFVATTRVTMPQVTFEERVHVGNGRLRFDKLGDETTTTLEDHDTRTTTFVVPAQQTALVFPVLLDGARTPDGYFAGPDGSPCRAEADLCERLGSEAVGPFKTVHWRVTQQAPEGAQSSEVWVDIATGVKVKTVTTGKSPMTVEFLSLEMGHQPDSLFVVPDGYLIARAQTTRAK